MQAQVGRATESDALWHKVILSIHGTHPNGWYANIVVKWSHQCHGKQLHKVSKNSHVLPSLWWGMGQGFVSGKTCGERINLFVFNFQFFLEL